VSAEETGLVPRDDNDAAADFADLGAIFASVIPVLGGAVNFVLNDWTAQRRYQRVRDVLQGLARDLQRFKADVKEECVRSDEFADLLDQTLRRVANERHEEKRRLYRGVLLGAITGQEQSYDEHLHTLRVIDSLQVAHMALLRGRSSRNLTQSGRAVSAGVSWRRSDDACRGCRKNGSGNLWLNSETIGC